ncbi:MAG: uncharacterized membrane protein YgdD (TMEM256/DUF423 family), partial [Lentisphaeria bacterium]
MSLPQQAKICICTAALSALLAVGLGAFGAHILKATLTPDAMATYQTAVGYQFNHALALLAVGLLLAQMKSSYWLMTSGILFAAGTVFFSGSLYGLAMHGPSWLG